MEETNKENKKKTEKLLEKMWPETIDSSLIPRNYQLKNPWL